MEKRNLNWVTWGFAALTILVVVMMLMNTLRRPVQITLPDTTEQSDPSTEQSDRSENALTVVEITPETVQAAVATLSRPESYRRTITVEQFWGESSGTYEVTTAVSGGWTRTDRTMPDGRVRHCISGEHAVYVWYQNETKLYTGVPGEITPDQDQSIPTYEDLLTLPTEEIVTADYRRISDVDCIYVEVVSEERDSTLRYWVSVETGLLVVAEKLEGEKTVYRMASLFLDPSEPAASEFLLPNGTQLVS